MGKGRFLNHAMKSKITPFGRWCPKPNARAKCMKVKIAEEHLTFTQASKVCEIGGTLVT